MPVIWVEKLQEDGMPTESDDNRCENGMTGIQNL